MISIAIPRLNRLLLSLIVITLLSQNALAQTEAVAEKPTEPQPTPLHLLTNEALLQQAEEQLSKLEYHYFAHSREIEEFEFQRERLQQQAKLKQFSKAEQSQDDTEPQQQAQLEQQLEQLRSYQQHLEQQRSLATDHLAAINRFVALLNRAIAQKETLLHYQREAARRQADGTLKQENLPKALSKWVINKRVESYENRLQQMQQAIVEVQQSLTTLTEQSEALQLTLNDKERDRRLLSQRLEQMAQQQQLQQRFQALSASALEQKMAELNREQTWIEKTLNQHLQDITQQIEQFESWQQQWQTPTQQQPSTSNEPSADSDLIALTQQLEQQQQQQRQWQQQLPKLQQQIEAAESDAALLLQQLFPLEVARTVMAQQQPSSETATEASQRLSASELTTLMGELDRYRQWNEQQQKQLIQIAQTIDQQQQQLQQRQLHQQMITQTAAQKEQWQDELSQIATTEVMAQFNDLKQQWQQQQQQLQQSQQQRQQAQKSQQQLQQQWLALQDPLLPQLTSNANAGHEQLIELFQFANIELPPELKQQANTEPQTDVPPSPSQTEPPLPPWEQQLQQLHQRQSSLRGRSRFESQQQQLERQQVEQLQQLIALEQSYLEQLNQSYLLAERRALIATELKKRVSQGETIEFPEPAQITTALKQTESEEALKQREQTLARLNHYRYYLEQRQLSPAKESTEPAEPEHGETAADPYLQLASQVGEQLDMMQQIDKLAAESQVEFAQLPAVEQSAQQQAAKRQLEQENSLLERAMAFFHGSEQLNTLNAIMAQYYLELARLRQQQQNLQQRQQRVERLVETTEQLRPQLEGSLATLKQQLQQLELDYEQELLIGKMALVPAESESLRQLFEAKYGLRPLQPPALPAAKREAYLYLLQQRLQILNYRIEAARRWSGWIESYLQQGLAQQSGQFSNI